MKRSFMLAALLFFAAPPALASDALQETQGPREAFMSGAILVKGEGASPEGLFTRAQKRVVALSAARNGALREAASILEAVTITGDTTVLNASALSGAVKTSAEGVIKGASVIREDYDIATGGASVFLSVPMEAVAAAIVPRLSSILPESPIYDTDMNAATGRYDGVIVDARGLGLKPALLNRLVSSNGEVIYDPSRASQKALSVHGSPAYANDVAQAKAILPKMGSVKPLVVKARGVARSTDLELGPIEAGAVFLSNRHAGFLEAARVVFVLD